MADVWYFIGIAGCVLLCGALVVALFLMRRMSHLDPDCQFLRFDQGRPTCTSSGRRYPDCRKCLE